MTGKIKLYTNYGLDEKLSIVLKYDYKYTISYTIKY